MVVTLKDIAKRAGVSQTVVSHVLNNRTSTVRVSDVKREVILKTAREMGYVPNLRARSMATGKTCTIGVIHTDPCDMENPMAQSYVFQVLHGVEDVCHTVDYHCLYASARRHRDDPFELPRVLQDGSLDGMILVDHTGEEDVQQILSLGIPCTHIGSNINPGAGIDFVYGDLDQAFVDSCHYLYKMGHRHIQLLFPSGPGPEMHAPAFKAMEEQYPDLSAEVNLFENVYAGYADALAYVDNVLAHRDKLPTAFIAPNSIWQGLVEGLSKHGYFCPTDYSLIGLTMTTGGQDSWLKVQPGNVPLSYILNPIGEVARHAARLLLNKLGVLELSDEERGKIKVPCELVTTGGSVADCGSSGSKASAGRRVKRESRERV